MTAARSNRLLADMTLAARSALMKMLEPVTLEQGDVLYKANTTIHHVYFPLDCFISLLASLKSHLPLEVAVVGREGMVGVPLALGMRTSLVDAVVRGAGTALRMSARTLREEMSRQPPLCKAIDRYVHSLIAQLAQTAACNAFHPLEARCARWLLMARDRMQMDELELTHEVLAQMLGVRRVGVTVAAGNLQRQGVIAYSRGRIVILNPQGLADAACECYGAVKKVHQTLTERRLIAAAVS